MSKFNHELVSVSRDATPAFEERFQAFVEALPRECRVEEVSMPSLRFRNLDMLVEASELITRKAPIIENSIRRVQAAVAETTGQSRVESRKGDLELQCAQSLSRFRWNETRYDLRDSVSTIVKKIIRDAEDIEENFQGKLAEYTEYSKKLDTEQKKYTTNTAALPMSRLVEEHAKQDIPLITEFLTTLFVVVPTREQEEWLRVYMELAEPAFIVPNSSVLVFSDQNNLIFSVTFFQKILGAFKTACLKRKWIVRDPRSEDSAPEHTLDRLQNITEELRGELIRLLYASLGEFHEAYAHLKVAECFIETILRYGLPPNFTAFTLHYESKDEKCIRNKLHALAASGTNSTRHHLSPDETDELVCVSLGSP